METLAWYHFALGAVLAAEFVKDNSGFLGMKDLFNF